MIYQEPPADYNPRFEVVGCLLRLDDRILLLRRHRDKEQGGKWCLPSGKIDEGEIPLSSMAREIGEETGIGIALSGLEYLFRVYVRYEGEYDFTFYMYSANTNKEDVHLNPEEHTEYRWVNYDQALKMDLVKDLDDNLHSVRSMKKI